eukprot:scaffold156405_cov33-Cyclotella_meneghiniana.AAC.1
MAAAAGVEIASVGALQQPSQGHGDDVSAIFGRRVSLMGVEKSPHQARASFKSEILQALITDIDPDNRVKQAMNEINSAKRFKFAVAEKAEGQKILQ